MLKLENEHVKKMGLTTIDYSEIFDRIKINAVRLSQIQASVENESSLVSEVGTLSKSKITTIDPSQAASEMTRIMGELSNCIKIHNFD